MGLLAPILVLALGWWAVQGAQLEKSTADTFDDRLATHPPEVVVLGSSLANRGIDLGVLARELDVPREDITMLQLPHAAAAHWYAVLKNRVFANGHRPRVVIIAGALTTMLNHDLLQYQGNLERLVEQLSDDEPVLAERVFREDDPLAYKARFARERASRVRAAALEGVRDRVVTWGFSKKGKLAEGRRLAEKVNEQVFANARMDYGLHKRQATGIFDPEDLTDLASDAGFDLRRDGLIGATAQLAAEHDAVVVWVRMPFPPSNHAMDTVPADVEADALAWMDEAGGGYLDMRSLDLDDADFEDMRHLSRSGAVKFTTALARSLEALGALSGDVRVVRGLAEAEGPDLVGAPTPLPTLADTGCVRRSSATVFDGWTSVDLPWGATPPLVVSVDGASLPEGDPTPCSGTWRVAEGALVVAPPSEDAAVTVAWADIAIAPDDGGPMAWALPGAGVRFTSPEAWTLPPNAFEIVARGRALGPAGEAMLTVGETTVPLQGDRRLVVSARLGPPDDAWTLDVTVPEGAPPVLLHHLGVGAAPATQAWLGQPETLHGASVRFVGGRRDDTRSEALYDAPPAWPATEVPLKRSLRTMAMVQMPLFAALADSPDKTFARPDACSPVRVLEDGEPLGPRHQVCYDVMTKADGRVCHAGKGLWFTASDGSSPLKNGRTYTLDLDPSRRCDTRQQAGAVTLRGSWWVYPGDAARFPVPSKRLRVLRDGASRLVVEILPLAAEASEPLQIALEVDGTVVAETTWAIAPGKRPQTRTFPLDPALSPGVRDVALRLVNPDASAFYLLTMASLEEGGEPEATFVVGAEMASEGRTYEAPGAFGRDGTPPALPPVKDAGEGAYRAHEGRLFPLWPVSDASLQQLGLGPWSPLRLEVDGVPLVKIGAKKVFRQGCASCFLHVGQAVLFRVPEGDVEHVVATLEPDFPLQARGSPAQWWVYPQTTAWFAPEGGWDGETVRVTARVLSLHPHRDDAGAGLRLRVGSAEAAFDPTDGAAAYVASVEVPAAEAGRVEVVNTDERGFAWIEEIAVTDAGGTRWWIPREADAGRRGR